MVTSHRPLHALIVDDDDGVRGAVSTALAAAGHRVFGASSCQEALDLAQGNRVDFGIVDVHVRAENGLVIVGCLRTIVRRLPVIFMSGDWTPDIEDRARHLGAHYCLEKPIDLGMLRQAVARLLDAEGLGG